jgi:hypothetical protein
MLMDINMPTIFPDILPIWNLCRRNLWDADSMSHPRTSRKNLSAHVSKSFGLNTTRNNEFERLIRRISAAASVSARFSRKIEATGPPDFV